MISKTRQEKYKMKQKHHIIPESKKSALKKKKDGACQKDTGTSMKGLSLAKSGTSWTLKWIMRVIDYNLLNKIRIYESILMIINK